MEYVTIHHIRELGSDLHYELRYGEKGQPTLVDFEQQYEPAETVLGTSNLEEAFDRAQGHVVNRQQNARHMVHSAMPTDVFEVHYGSDSVEDVAYFMVEAIGFREIDWGAELPREMEVGK